MTRRRDVFLDPWSRQQHRAAGTRFSLRHARTHTLLAGRGVRFEGRHDLGGRGAVSMASRHAFRSGVLVAHPSPEDRQRTLAERGLASLDGRRVEMLDQHAGEPAHAIHQLDGGGSGSARRARSTRVVVRTRARRVGAGPGPAHSIPSRSVSTASTALDPVDAIAEVAREHGLWLHVDAAMAGSAMILPECRWMWEGIEGADSVVLNPHKWLGAAFDCSVYFVRDPEHLVRVMSTNPSYLQSAVDNRVRNLRDWGIPLGRRFRALKLWCLIREQGVAGLQARLRRDLENARWLEGQIRATPGWRVLAPVPLQTLCVRHEPSGMSGEDLDRHTQGWANRINRSGAAYLTPAILDGRWMVRVSVGAIPTEREHVAALWAQMRNEAEVAG